MDVEPSYWPDNMNEYFLIGIQLHLLHCLPCTLRRLRSVWGVERKLHSMRKDKLIPQGIVLRIFLSLYRRVSGMSDGLVWQLFSG